MTKPVPPLTIVEVTGTVELGRIECKRSVKVSKFNPVKIRQTPVHYLD